MNTPKTTTTTSPAAEPWQARPEWTDPLGIPQRVGLGWKRTLLFFFGVALMGLAALSLLGMAVAGFSGRDEQIRNPGNWAQMLIFACVGAWLFRLAKREANPKTASRLARFVPLALPVPFGGELSGMIVAPRPVAPTANGRVSLSCWRRELRVEEDENRRTVREQRELIGETTERIVRPEDWERSVTGSQVVVQLPVRGGKPSTQEKPSLGHPAIEWVLKLEMPAAGGKLAFEFPVPVFPTPGAGGQVEEPALEAGRLPVGAPAVAEAVAAALEPAALAPESPDDQRAALENAHITLQPMAGAVGGHALALDAHAAEVAGRLAWVGLVFVLVIAGFLGVVSLFLFAIPYLGLVLAPAALVGLAVLVVHSFRDTLRKNSGPETVWVEEGVIRVTDRRGRTRDIPRSDLARIEVAWGGTTGATQYFALVAASQPAPGKQRRRRQRIVGAVRSREAAQAVGHWLSRCLGLPPVPVVDVQQGVELLEWSYDWMGKRR
jgi:hypothetical protein